MKLSTSDVSIYSTVDMWAAGQQVPSVVAVICVCTICAAF